ncbi:uncharacterized protein BP01DRAFT_12575 [Aspergillus saccharolyticus JOP 1030-1]|uniref:Uncharacterized protein n=1 Tax=Aspergillus saccharolyticus JOP 1030-1 TaxID=1450539 RepID=A0A319AEV1_9EURO|nr:hypothetical protein BP01DRAFT_12575 [Aspergillus saccharolyticus JOP 1030-1]PYH50018.1 hypothetical protein BP01DRAFT_12575 [Aspergillus saccharolyticus JOP 1030-1]
MDCKLFKKRRRREIRHSRGTKMRFEEKGLEKTARKKRYPASLAQKKKIRKRRRVQKSLVQKKNIARRYSATDEDRQYMQSNDFERMAWSKRVKGKNDGRESKAALRTFGITERRVSRRRTGRAHNACAVYKNRRIGWRAMGKSGCVILSMTYEVSGSCLGKPLF